ncbi:hypothetical protein BB559_003250 [Furculomyces boomerangus]|uniref:Glucosamine 6-phosphate N-acetyltransferase n=2 Tax=Harpellales TaxID=61421 RepID=A0A2T9YMH5_9FUNG|nr:hypothetical protein BB559_003250 [Furculomyces boomerangus]PVZ99800.1 hypothetical protein BB558_004173 [Smittium angustum]
MTSGKLLFDPKLLGNRVSSILPSGFEVRPLSLEDYSNGFYDCMEQLTVVGDVTQKMYADQFNKMKRSEAKFIVVIVDKNTDRVAATGAVFTELKFARNCGQVAHIEDVSVHADFQGRKLGAMVVEQLKDIALGLGCYKISLNCNDGNIPFYEKCGLERKEIQMVLYTKNSQKL